jgi:hypothetical protein
MFIDPYYNALDGKISFTREQGSNFAKQVADDFNPLHDHDAKRFCIPGDLLFSIILAKYGLSQHMEFVFSGMVVEGIELVLPEASAELSIDDTQGKHYLSIACAGDTTRDPNLIDDLTRNYVEFSGHTFPHILVPLLAQHNLMLNPSRPVVIYESMTIDLDRLDISKPVLEIDTNTVEITGKRGDATLAFNLLDNGSVVGRGRKHMILGGLRDYDEQAMAAAIAAYNQLKTEFVAA